MRDGLLSRLVAGRGCRVRRSPGPSLRRAWPSPGPHLAQTREVFAGVARSYTRYTHGGRRCDQAHAPPHKVASQSPRRFASTARCEERPARYPPSQAGQVHDDTPIAAPPVCASASVPKPAGPAAACEKPRSPHRRGHSPAPTRIHCRCASRQLPRDALATRRPQPCDPSPCPVSTPAPQPVWGPPC